MPITADAFRTERPEFKALSDAMINPALARAELEITKAGDWGDLRNSAVSLLAAHFLWDSPFGATIRLEGGEQEKSSRYMRQFRELRNKALPHNFVI